MNPVVIHEKTKTFLKLFYICIIYDTIALNLFLKSLVRCVIWQYLISKKASDE